MKYYVLRKESDPKIMGVKSGVSQVEIDETGFKNKEMYGSILSFFDTYWKKTSFHPALEYQFEAVRMLPHTKLTDFLYFRPFLTACPFMVSERIKILFDDFNIQEHYYFPVNIYKKEKPVDDLYSVLYCPLQDYDIIDFSKSTFFSGSAISGKKYFQFKDKNEFLGAQDSYPLLTGERVVLNNSFDRTLDLFNPRFGQVYVSEKLKNALEAIGPTGIKILDAVDPQIEV